MDAVTAPTRQRVVRKAISTLIAEMKPARDQRTVTDPILAAVIETWGIHGKTSTPSRTMWDFSMAGERRVSVVEDGTGAQSISDTDEEVESGGKGSHDERERGKGE
jgi:hypothetical protein